MSTKEEAISRGIPLAPRSNDMHRRAPWHDYRLPGLYMLTITTLNRQRLLGTLITTPSIYVDLSPLGRAIAESEVCKIAQVYPNVKVWKLCVMPDHIHLIIEVMQAFAEGKSLGTVVTGFKAGCNKAYRRIAGVEGGTMFNPKYNDRIILPGQQCDGWKRYLDDNPRRLALKQKFPELFTTRYDMPIAGKRCQVIGNIFLLDLPDKMAVIVHRRDTDEEYARKVAEWMACGERGGVLVSAAVSPREKEVMRLAHQRGYCVIELKENGFSPYYKPAGEAFDACAAGQLLQISPWQYHAERRTITRAQCLALNALAEQIATPTGRAGGSPATILAATAALPATAPMGYWEAERLAPPFPATSRPLHPWGTGRRSVSLRHSPPPPATVPMRLGRMGSKAHNLPVAGEPPALPARPPYPGGTGRRSVSLRHSPPHPCHRTHAA